MRNQDTKTVNEELAKANALVQLRLAMRAGASLEQIARVPDDAPPAQGMDARAWTETLRVVGAALEWSGARDVPGEELEVDTKACRDALVAQGFGPSIVASVMAAFERFAAEHSRRRS